MLGVVEPNGDDTSGLDRSESPAWLYDDTRHSEIAQNVTSDFQRAAIRLE